MWTTALVTLFCLCYARGDWGGCPEACRCWEEHWADLPARRLENLYREQQPPLHPPELSNDVWYAEDEPLEDNPLMRVAVCQLAGVQPVQPVQPSSLLDQLPRDTEVLTLLEQPGAPNTTLYFSHLLQFDSLISLDIVGLEFSIENRTITSQLTCVLDVPLRNLKYLTLNNIILRGAPMKHQTVKINNEMNQDQTINMLNVQGQDEILPYNIYISKQKDGEFRSFVGYDNLFLLRIHSCNLQNIYWEMFEGLKNLFHLILENNNLKFIPDFAFYGTPNLHTLSLAKNNLLNIQITDLAGLLELEYLDLSNNNFSQLSELSFPPFPKLKLADFQNNPITSIFPNTFEVMNTTGRLVVGCRDIGLELQPNSFLGLDQLVELTLINVSIPVLERDFFNGLPQLTQLTINGDIRKIQFDAFAQLKRLEKLILSRSNITTVSMDAFFGLANLKILDLSNNKINIIPPGIFDEQIYLKELYLHGNEINTLPKNLFKNMKSIKLIRLNNNPWFCSCDMSDWSPKVTNKVKKVSQVQCDRRHDKGSSCVYNKSYKYEYDNRVAPKCQSPIKYRNTGVFQILRKYLQCNKIIKFKIIKSKVLPLVKTLPNQNVLKKLELVRDSINYKKKDNLFINQYKKQPVDIQNNLNPLSASNTNDMTIFSKKDYEKTTVKKNKQNLRTLGKLRRMQFEKKH